MLTSQRGRLLTRGVAGTLLDVLGFLDKVIAKLHLQNFKSFDQLHLDLGTFNVVVGANASGKSNFLQAFKFVRDIGRYSLDDAIGLQGGIAFLRNVREDKSKPTVIEMVTDANLTLGFPVRFTVSKSNKQVYLQRVKVQRITRSLTILPKSRGPGYTIENDSVLLEIEELQSRPDQPAVEGMGTLKLTKAGRKISYDLHYPGVKWRPDVEYLQTVGATRGPQECLSFTTDPLSFARLFVMDPVAHDFYISSFDFDARLFKQAVRISGRSGLDETGENLAVILQGILRNSTQRKLLLSHLTDILPFVSKLETERFTDNTLLFSLIEKYHSKGRFPASLISDGTVSVIAILVALLFDKSDIVTLEEPERNVHPYLISGLIEIAKDISHRKQIIITTHSSAVVAAARLEDLLIVKRDTKGYTRITRPADSAVVREFIKHDLGVRELFESKLLEK